MTWQISFRVVDEKRGGKGFEMHVPAPEAFEDVVLFAQEMAKLIDQLITGQVRNISLYNRWIVLPENRLPAANSDCEERARLTFWTAEHKSTRLEIATLDENNAIAGTDVLDADEPDVAALIEAMISGIDLSAVGGSGTIQPCDVRGSDIVSLSKARAVHRVLAQPAEDEVRNISFAAPSVTEYMTKVMNTAPTKLAIYWPLTDSAPNQVRDYSPAGFHGEYTSWGEQPEWVRYAGSMTLQGATFVDGTPVAHFSGNDVRVEWLGEEDVWEPMGSPVAYVVMPKNTEYGGRHFWIRSIWPPDVTSWTYQKNSWDHLDLREFTVSFWVKAENLTAWSVPGEYEPGESNIRQLLGLHTDWGRNQLIPSGYSQFEVYAQDDVLSFNVRTSLNDKNETVSVPIATTDWVNIAFSFSASGDQFKAYVNGIQQGATLTGFFVRFNPLSTLMFLGNLYGWKGAAAHFAYWNTALLPGQIAALATV